MFLYNMHTHNTTVNTHRAAADAGPKPKGRSDVALYYTAGPKRQSVIFRIQFSPTPSIRFPLNVA